MKFNQFAIGLAAVLSLALFTPSTSLAQVPTYSQPVISLPNIQASSTSNLATPVYIDLSRSKTCGFQFKTSYSVTSAGTLTNATYTLAPSMDGINMDTNNTFTVVAPARTTVNNIYVTNGLPAAYQDIQGVFITSIQNGHASGILTNSVIPGQKISSP
jgi:hypothetical protein